MRAIVGARIRERRRVLGITQAALARRLGISASYLNLIEHNKRGVAGRLLRRAAEALDLALEDLDGAAERRLLVRLEEIAHIPDIAALGAEADGAGELLGRFPGWARAVSALANGEREARDLARALADRLTHDPFLGETVHRMLTRIAAVRSAAEILVEYAPVEDPRLARFLDIVHDESRALSDVGEALAAYFDKADRTERVLTPLGEVDSLFEARENRFAEIEHATAALADEVAGGRPGSRLARARELSARRIGPDIDRIIEAEPRIETALGRSQARQALLVYATAALLAPMDVFAREALALDYDLEALADAFSVGIDVACHRLSALPAGDGVPRFGYLQANAAGTIVVARGLPGLIAPRFASACPLWVLFRAQQSPENVLRQRTLFPNGTRFVLLARARRTGADGFGKPRHYVTDMLAVSERDAALTVYAPDDSVLVEPVGPSCLSCPRRDCAHRVVDPIAG